MSYLILKSKSEHSVAPLNGVRAIACVFVVLSHLSISFSVFPVLKSMPFGHFGVGLFFLLSGFLMSHLYFSRPWSGENLISYGVARFSRIAPVYWLIVFLSYVLSNTVLPDFVYRMDAHNLLRHVFFGGNVSIFWSISPEVQYYLFFALFWFSFATFRNGNIYPLIIFSLLSIIMTYFRVISPGLFLASKLHFFLFGSCFGAFSLSPEFLNEKKFIIQVVQAVCIPFVFLYVFFSDVNYLVFYHRLDFSLLIGVSVFLISHSTKVSEALFSGKVFKAIGAASFSIYLLHDIVIYFFLKIISAGNDVFSFLICAILCIGMPVIFSMYIEMPLCKFIKSRLIKIINLTMTKNATVSG